MRRTFLVLFFVCILGVALHAQVLGNVRGVVHDPQHRPVAGASVTLKAANSAWSMAITTGANGEFAFNAVPVGDYRILVTDDGFTPASESLTVVSDSSPVVHVQLELPSMSQSATVTAAPASAAAQPFTPVTLLDRAEIDATPGASRANSLAMITDYTPGAYLTHDMLHVRGGHQTSWLIDGVAIPNLNIGSNLAPTVDPHDVDYLESLRGSYGAEYGDRTYGEFDVVPRSGFDMNGDAELDSTFGSFYQTDDTLSLGDHTDRLAWYLSLNGNRSNLGLETPVAQPYHDAENGGGMFASLLFNANPDNQFRLDAQVRRDYYQIPYDPDPNDFENSQYDSSGLRDHQSESDGYLIATWTHTFNPNMVLTVSPFYHRNHPVYGSAESDTPVGASYALLSTFIGGQADFTLHSRSNEVEGGLYAWSGSEHDTFGLVFNDGSGLAPLSEADSVNGNEEAVYLSDDFSPAPWLTLSAGLRETRFAAKVEENTAYPRLGASLRIPHTDWVAHAFWGRFYQPPPLVSLSGPLLSYLSSISTQQNPTSFVPLHGERDEEHQFGITVPVHDWHLDADTFDTRGVNFLDHNNIGESDIFIPVTVAQSRIIGNELTLRSPRMRGGAQVHLAYSNQIAEAQGDFTGGLLVGLPAGPGWGLLDHDQRNTLNVGGSITLPYRITASTNIYYGSGFSNAYAPPAHLPGHADVDLTLGHPFTDNLSASVTALNLANSHLLIDNSLTFGGFHWDNPREVYVEVRYRFKPGLW